jgi:hypothetical protein
VEHLDQLSVREGANIPPINLGNDVAFEEIRATVRVQHRLDALACSEENIIIFS